MSLNRRFMISCALCGLTGLTASAVNAQPAAPAFRRKVLQQIDGPAEGYQTLVVEIEIDAGALVARHTHPGIESTYLMEGGGVLSVEGQAPRKVGPGDAFQVPAGVPHSMQNGDKPAKAIANFIVEKGKPLATPA